MSLDLEICNPPCTHCGREEDEGESFNCTYNLSRMWYAIYPDDQGMVPIEGLTGTEALPKLQEAYNVLIERREFMESLQPANRWGTYIGFLHFIQQLISASERYPDGVWKADR